MRSSALTASLLLALIPVLSVGAQSQPRYQVTPHFDVAYLTSIRDQADSYLIPSLHKSVGLAVRVTPWASRVGLWADVATGTGRGGVDACAYCDMVTVDISTLRLGGGITYRVSRPGRTAITDLLLGAHFTRLSTEGYGTTHPLSNVGVRLGLASDLPFSDQLTMRLHLTDAVTVVDGDAYRRQFDAGAMTRVQHMVQGGIGLSFYLF